MKTILKNTAQIFRADWGPTMKASTSVLALAVAMPAAIVWVLAQWLLFTYRKPLEGVLALVPVRKPEMAYSSARLAMASQVVASRIIDPIVSPTIEISPAPDATLSDLEEELLQRIAQLDFGPTADELMRPIATSDLVKAGASIHETELGPMTARMDFRMASTTKPVAPQTLVLAPKPRRQRRGSKQPQSPV